MPIRSIIGSDEMRPIVAKIGKSKQGIWTNKQKMYVARAIGFGCLLSWLKDGIEQEPAEWNHIRSGIGMRPPHQEGFALSPRYHRLGNDSLQALGTKVWEKLHGYTEIELVKLSKELHGWQEDL
jgi:hypothetical protein